MPNLLFVLIIGLILHNPAVAEWDVSFEVEEGTWMSVDVSPDGRHLVFDLLGDIYTLPASGGTARLVHGGPAIERNPRFSPDGESLLYISDRSGSDNAWVSDSNGSNARQLTDENVNVLAGASWATDGQSVIAARVFAVSTRRQGSEIRLYHSAGGSGRILVPTPANGRDVQEARISPDGEHLYYTQRLTDTGIVIDPNHGHFAIQRRDLATGETVELLRGFGGAVAPQPSPDGRQLAFVRRVKDKTVLFLYDAESGEQRPVYDDLDRDLQADFVQQGTYYPPYNWFPDNRHIAIWGKGRLFRIDTRTGDASEIPFHVKVQQRITEVPRVEHELAPSRFTARAVPQVAVQPDGDSAVFVAVGRLGRKSLPDGKPQRVSSASAVEFDPVFSADGKRLAYVAWDDEKGSTLNVVGANGRNGRTLAHSRGLIRQPAFSPDGSELVYAVDGHNKTLGGYRASAGLFRVPVAGGASQRIADEGLAPQFSSDGRRVYYVAVSYEGDDQVHRLLSITTDGYDEHEHARATGADRSQLRLSPDGRWLAFMEKQQFYLLPYRETGDSLTVSASDSGFPVAQLTNQSGYGLSWSADSKTLYWMLGEELYGAIATERLASVATVPDTLSNEPLARLQLELPSDTPEGTTAFTNGRVITMRGDEVIEKGSVLVRGNRIEAVGEADKVDIPDAARVVDLKGATVMPGLVDMHGHIDCCYMGGPLPQKQPGHYAAMAFGVTTNFDPYTSDFPSYMASEMQRAGLATGPRSIGSGRVIYGRVNKGDASYEPVFSYQDAVNLMRRKKALGGLVIKSYRQPMRSQRQMLVKAGREVGVRVDVEGESHFYNNIGMILDGHMNLEHNLPVANYYEDVIQLLAHGETSNTPTLIVTFGEIFGENYFYQSTRAWEEPRIRSFVQEVISGYSPLNVHGGAPMHVRAMTSMQVADEIWEVGFKSVARSVRRQEAAGVITNAGSHGQVAGLTLHWEMWLMALGGMEPHRILRTATWNGARTLGLDQQIGSLEVGKLADLIILEENPLEDIRNSTSVRYTMVNGRLYDALSMDEIGHYERPRGKFYWELEDYHGIDWNEAWSGQ